MSVDCWNDGNALVQWHCVYLNNYRCVLLLHGEFLCLSCRYNIM